MLPPAYPSESAPLVLVETQFYQQFRDKILKELKFRWTEGCPVLFDYVNFIWDEMVDGLGLTNGKQDVCLEYTTDSQF